MLAGVLMIMHRGNNWVADSHSLPWLQLQREVLLYLYLVNGFFVAKRHHHHHHQAFMLQPQLSNCTLTAHTTLVLQLGPKHLVSELHNHHMEEEFPQSSLSEWLLMHTHVWVKNYSFCTTWSQMQRCQPRVHGGPWGVMSKLHCILSSVKTVLYTFYCQNCISCTA